MQYTPVRRFRQTIETADLNRNFQAGECVRLSGGLFAHCSALNSRNPRDVQATKAVEWHLSR